MHFIPTFQGSWQREPMVCVDFSEESLKHKHSVLTGIKEWKVQLGKYFNSNAFDFQMSTRAKNCDINVSFYKTLPVHDAYGATACRTDGGGGLEKCTVEIYLDRTPTQLVKNVVTHEIGHAFGFSHERTEKQEQYVYVILKGGIMLNGVTKHSKIDSDLLWAFEQKYGRNGWSSTADRNMTSFYPPNHNETFIK